MKKQFHVIGVRWLRNGSRESFEYTFKYAITDTETCAGHYHYTMGNAVSAAKGLAMIMDSYIEGFADSVSVQKVVCLED